jgi:deoxyribose-phosphate aldolase
LFPDFGWLNSIHINLPAIKRHATLLQSRHSVKKEWQAAWLLGAITCIDLTTLGGDDTASNIARLCAKVRITCIQSSAAYDFSIVVYGSML